MAVGRPRHCSIVAPTLSPIWLDLLTPHARGLFPLVLLALPQLWGNGENSLTCGWLLQPLNKEERKEKKKEKKVGGGGGQWKKKKSKGGNFFLKIKKKQKQKRRRRRRNVITCAHNEIRFLFDVTQFFQAREEGGKGGGGGGCGESGWEVWTGRRSTILRLRTGHCQLLSYLHRLKISHSDECPCGTGPQTSNHILQSCPTFDALRRQTWPSPVDAHRKLWGPVNLRHCGRQRTSPYSPDWRSSMAGNAEDVLFCLLVAYRPSNMRVYLRDGSAQTILRAATLR